MYLVVYNRFTNSPVTQGEAWVTVIWEGMDTAWDYAKSLDAEYAVKFPEMPQERRTWAVRQATPDEVAKAKASGIIGPEWAQVLGKGQIR